VAVSETSEIKSVLSRRREALVWVLIAAYLAAVIRFAWEPSRLAQILAAIGFAGAVAHSSLTYGRKNTLALLIICLTVTFAMENIGAMTGFPFGHYHFEVGAELPHVGAITIIVGGVWFGAGYFAWVVAGTLLGGGDRNLNRRFKVITLPIVAAFVMTQWDFVMDAPESTISKAWIWHDGGGDFGVPLTNYLGWLLTSWMFYQVFALYLARRTDMPPTRRVYELRLAAILFYACSGLTHLTPWFMGQNGEAVDAAGHFWRIQDLREAAVAGMLFTMFFTSILAALRLADDDCRT